MKSVKTLIDMAAAKAGSDAELARRIGDTRHNIGSMRRGTRAVSPETVAKMCDLLELPGEEAREWLAVAVIENPKNASKRSLLERALFACWGLGAASLCTLSGAGLLTPGTARSEETATIAAHIERQHSNVSVTDNLTVAADLIRRSIAWLCTALAACNHRAGVSGLLLPG